MFSQKLVVVVSLFPQIFVCASSWGSRSYLAACSAEVRQESISGGRTLLSFLVVLDMGRGADGAPACAAGCGAGLQIPISGLIWSASSKKIFPSGLKKIISVAQNLENHFCFQIW